MDAISFSYDWSPWLFWIALVASVVGAVLLSRIPLVWMVVWAIPALIVYKGIDWAFPLDGWFKVVFWIVFWIVLVLPIPFGWKTLPFTFISGLFALLLFIDFVGWTVGELGEGFGGGSGVRMDSPSDVVSSESTPTSSPTGPSFGPSVPTSSATNSPPDNPSATDTTSPPDEPTSTSSPTSAPTSSSTSAPSSDGGGEVADYRYYSGQTPTIPRGTCPGMLGWDTLVKCVEDNDLQWYKDGVNARAAQTGFNWSDVLLWADARTRDGQIPEVRYINVYGNEWSDSEAIAWARPQVHKDLHVVRQPACFDNTIGLEVGQMRDFRYCPEHDRQVRISLMPLQLELDANGEPVRDDNGHTIATDALNTGAGVFADCLNVWKSVRFGK